VKVACLAIAAANVRVAALGALLAAAVAHLVAFDTLLASHACVLSWRDLGASLVWPGYTQPQWDF